MKIAIGIEAELASISKSLLSGVVSLIGSSHSGIAHLESPKTIGIRSCQAGGAHRFPNRFFACGFALARQAELSSISQSTFCARRSHRGIAH